MSETKPKLVTLHHAEVVNLRDLLQLIDDDPDIDLGRKDEMAERVSGALWYLDAALTQKGAGLGGYHGEDATDG